MSAAPMQIDQFVAAAKQLEALFESAPIAIGMIEMPAYRFVAANTRYRNTLKERSVADDFIGKTVAEVLPKANPKAVQSLERAHKKGLVSRFKALKSQTLSGSVSFWTGASFPVLQDDGRTVVLGLLIDVTERHLKKAKQGPAAATVDEDRKIDKFVEVAMRGLKKPRQGKLVLHLLRRAINNDWPDGATDLAELEQAG